MSAHFLSLKVEIEKGLHKVTRVWTKMTKSVRFRSTTPEHKVIDDVGKDNRMKNGILAMIHYVVLSKTS